MPSSFGAHCEAGVTEPRSTAETEPGWQCGRVQQLPGQGRWAEEGASVRRRLACRPGGVDRSRLPHVLGEHVSGSRSLG